MRLSRTPHFMVASAMWSCIRALIVSRWERDWSRVSSPNTARRAVRESWSTANWKSLISNRAAFTSITWQKMVALTCSETLSSVMTELLVPGHRELAHVDLLHAVDEGHQDVHPRLADALELTEPLDDPDAPLLHDLESRAYVTPLMTTMARRHDE